MEREGERGGVGGGVEAREGAHFVAFGPAEETLVTPLDGLWFKIYNFHQICQSGRYYSVTRSNFGMKYDFQQNSR